MSAARELAADQIVTVVGVVRSCERRSCLLWDRKDPNGLKYAGLGGDKDFDQLIQDHLNKDIVIEAEFDPSCLPDWESEIWVGCSDRATVLKNPKFVGLSEKDAR